MPKFLSDGIFDGSSTDLTVDGSFRSKGDLNYFGLDNISNEAEIVINTGNSGSPQIGFTENGDASWAIGVDDADNGFKIHGSVSATIPTINNLTKPFFEIDPIGQIFQRPLTGSGSYTKLGFEVNTQEVALELGDDRTGSGFAYIDLIGDTTYVDYGLRLIRWDGGANTTSHLRHRGTGYLEIETEDGGDILINPNSGNVGIFETNPTQKLHVAGNARVTGAYYDSSNLPGTSGQLLSSTATGTGWVDANTIASGSAEVVEVPVKNLQGSALTKGDPVYISGDVGASGRLEVKLADAGQSAKMPAVGLLKQDLGINGEGFAVVTGKLRNLVTSPIDGVTPTANTVIYVKPGGTTGAALTTVKPTGSNLIQNMGKVGRVSTSNDGTFVVSSILRTNDIPNLTQGKIWVGSTGNTIESTVVHLDETNGRMGIGTTNPRVPLQVSSSEVDTDFLIECDSTQSRMSINNTSTGDSQINFQLSNSSKFTIGVDNSDSDKFKISAGSSLGSSDRIVVDSSGNVGIGTTSPASILHVEGGSPTTNLIASSGNGFLRIADSATSATRKEFTILLDNANNRVDMQAIQQGVAARNITLNASGGNVGIGTTNPLTKLQVGDGTADDAVRSYFNDGSYTEMRGYGLQFSRAASYIRPTADNTKTLYLGSNVAQWGALSIDASTTTFNTNGSENMRITSTGNVGIGTTSPVNKLNVVGDIGYTGVIGQGSIYGNPGNSSYATMQLYNSSTGYTTLNNQSFGYYFNTGGGNKLTILNSGNVGIGTTSPVQKLEVNGNIKLSETAAATDTDKFVVLDSGVLKYRTGAQVISDLPTDSRYVAVPGDTMTGTLNINRSGTGQIVVNSQAHFGTHYTNTDVWIYGANAGSNIFLGGGIGNIQNDVKIENGDLIVSNGDVGIGETNPDAKLTVFRTDTTYAVNLSDTESRAGLSVKSSSNFDSKLTISSGASSRQYIQAVNNAATTGRDIAINPYGGNVGIGTTSPGKLLELSGGENVAAIRLRDTTSNIWDIQNSTFGKLDFIRGGTNTYMRIDQFGNVGIGATSPGAKLHVSSGTANEDCVVIIESDTDNNDETSNPRLELRQDGGAVIGRLGYRDNTNSLELINQYGEALYLGTSNSTDLTILSDGSVGIGTTSPSSKLTVVDDILLTGSSPSLTLTDATSSFVVTTNTAGEGIIKTSADKNIRFFINDSTETMRIAATTGNVGIGTTNPAEKLDVVGSIKATGQIWAGYDAGTNNSVSCSNWFRSNGTTGWYNASYGGGIYMTDTTNVTVYNSKAFRVNNTGTLSIRSAGDIVAYYSDERLKTNLGNITNAVDKVKKLNGFYYTNNDLAQEFGYTEKQVQVGVSAQEVENVMPEVVKPAPFDLGVNENGSTYSISGDDYKTVKYEKLVPLLIEAIKEQQKQIDELKSQLNAFTK